MTTIGIDLGTTNSVVAVPGDHAGKGVLFGSVTVIYDDVERLTQASAVCNVDGEILVGDDAKDLASQGYTPVRFVKKYMGTEETFQVGDEEWTAEKVSAKVLEHMVRLAEQALGIKVERAFVTHPAYFDALAIDATREAARMAGLDVDGRLMMEPVAAAMAYTVKDESPELRILVYDLGGGTFDVTLVDRTSGMFTPLAFGGNRELGGYNFDKKIATKMLAALREKGYEIQIDTNRPERDSRWASLMHHAEQIKIRLSSGPKADIRIPGVFKDDSTPPKSVQLAFSMTKKEFAELIEPEIQETIDATWEVLEKGEIVGKGERDVESVKKRINHLVLVGGSSRIPVIQERLQKEFQLDPEYSDDIFDLSVAVGAAMAAASEGTIEGSVMLGNIPERVDDQLLVISGKVVADDDLKDPSKCTVTVRGGLDEEYSTTTGNDGGFYLEVELYEDEENELELLIETPGGKTLLERKYTVTHDASVLPPPEKPGSALPKPICVDTDVGLVELAPENVQLPFKKTVSFQTVDELTEIPIDVYQEDVQLSTLILKDFSSPIPARTQLDIKLEIGEDYSMTITAIVPSADISKSQEIKLTRPVIPDAAELKSQFATILQTYRGQLDNMPDGDAKAKATAVGDRIVEQIEEMLAEEHPERMQIFMLMQKLSLKIKQMTDDLRPPKGEVDADLAEARKLLPQAIKKQPALQEQDLGRALDLLEQQAGQAYQEKDADAWARTARRIREVKVSIEQSLQEQSPGMSVDDLPDPSILAAKLEAQIRELEQIIASGRYPGDDGQARAEISQARTRLAQVDMNGGNASKQEIEEISLQHLRPITEMLDTGQDAGAQLPGGKGPIHKI